MHPQIFSALVTRRTGNARGFGRATWTALAMWIATAVTLVTGCGPQLQTQIVGRSTAFAGPPNPAAPAVVAEIPVPESHSAQVLHYVVALPHAVQLHYQVTCPTAERDGTIGE